MKLTQKQLRNLVENVVQEADPFGFGTPTNKPRDIENEPLDVHNYDESELCPVCQGSRRGIHQQPCDGCNGTGLAMTESVVNESTNEPVSQDYRVARRIEFLVDTVANVKNERGTTMRSELEQLKQDLMESIIKLIDGKTSYPKIGV